MNIEWQAKLMAAAKRYLEADAVIRANPISLSACGPDLTTKEGWLYECQRNEFQSAESKLWMLTDCEYDDKDPLRAACWEWRYCKVMARKCCHYQLTTGKTDWAAETMRKLSEAETNLMTLLGLYPKLKKLC